MASLTAWMKRFFLMRRRSSLSSLFLRAVNATTSPFESAENLEHREVRTIATKRPRQ